MQRYNISAIIISIIVYSLIGYILITMLPFLLVAIIIGALIMGIILIVQYFRFNFNISGRKEKDVDEYGSRKTESTIIEMKEANETKNDVNKDKNKENR